MEEVAKTGTASHSSTYKPRDIGATPLVRLPNYIQIDTLPSGEYIAREMSIPEAFKYFYGISYESYKKMIQQSRCRRPEIRKRTLRILKICDITKI